MQTCKEIIDLASRRLDSKLSWRKNLGFRLHLLMCKTCTRYATQLGFIRKASAQWDRHFHDTKLSLAARQRIVHKLSKHKSTIE